MINIDRLKMAVDGIDITDDKLGIYLTENGLNSNDEYNPESNSNKKGIFKTALSILEDIANNPKLMKEYKTEDITVSQFSENLQSRIDYLDRKIRMIPDDSDTYTDGNGFIYIFKN